MGVSQLLGEGRARAAPKVYAYDLDDSKFYGERRFRIFIKLIDTDACHPDFRLTLSYLTQYQKHATSSFCYYLKSFDDSVGAVYKGKGLRRRDRGKG